MYSYSLFTLALAAASSLAAPTSDALRRTRLLTVYNPDITSPVADQLWCSGSTVNVTWDTSDMPEEAFNNTGRILLGYGGDEDDLHLDVENPLADGFLIRSDSTSVIVPDVQPRKNYFIVVMGNSGNTSPEFSINKCTDGGEGEEEPSTPEELEEEEESEEEEDNDDVDHED